MKPHHHSALRTSPLSAFRLQVFRLSGFSLGAALAVCTLSAQTAQPSLDVFPHNGAPGEIATFKQGERIFTNRNFRFEKPPAVLDGNSFLRVPIDGMEIRCTAPGELFVLTPSAGSASIARALLARGFAKETRFSDFHPWGGKNELDYVSLYRKTLKEGETLKLGKWCIVFGFAKANFKRAEIDTSEAGLAKALTNRIWQGIPGIERTGKGRLFFVWYTGGEVEPKEENMVLLCYSDDGGKTHSPLQVLGPPAKDGTRAYDPVPWIDPKGRLWFYFNRGNKTSGMHGVYARICEHPDAPEPVFGPEFRVGFDVPYSLCMNKPTVLSSGEWLMPVSYAKEPIYDWGTYSSSNKAATKPALQGVGISLDEGKTWKLHGAVPETPMACENMLIELKDGRLWMLMRTLTGCLWESFSSDKGITWSTGAQTTIANPDTRFFIRRLASGNLLLVNHFGNDPKARSHDKRSHLTAQLSTDDGKTWNTGLLLDERKRISYPDGVQGKDGVIWIIYDRNRRGMIEHEQPDYGHILVARFLEEDLARGKNVSGAVVLRQVINSIPRKAAPGKGK